MVLLAALIAASAACAGPTTSKPAPPSSDAGRTASTSTTRVDPAQAARLQRIMVPIIPVMDNPMPLDHVKVGIMDDHQALRPGQREPTAVNTGITAIVRKMAAANPLWATPGMHGELQSSASTCQALAPAHARSGSDAPPR